MRFLHTSAVLILSCGAVAAFGQSAPPAAATSTATAPKGPVDLSGFREHIEEKNKALNEQVSTTKAIVKKNTAILEDAKRIDADNRRLAAERRALEAQNAEFARESQAMQSETNGVSAATPQPAPPVRVEPVAPAKVEPAPPAAIETASAPRVETMVPARPEPIDPGPAIAANAPIARPTVNEAVGPSVSIASDSGPVRISSGVSQGMLLTPITPIYPSIAVTAHVEGAVVMEAVISKEGNIASVRAVSGPMMLREAALDAVKVARYRPYSVNGQLTEVAATIKVVFQLGR